jgi:hypothetical protein
MSPQRAPRVLTSVAVTTMVLAVIGFITALALNAFVFDEYDAYGEVPIPGSGTVHLPAGAATISLHTMVIGNGGAVPVPKMSIGIKPPAGVSDPVLTEDVGATTTVNNDAHIRVWTAQIPADGDYTITADGNVTAYVNPTLAFGHASPYGYLPIVFAVAFGLAIVVLVVARMWASRVRRSEAGVGYHPVAPAGPPVAPVGPPHQPWVPTDQGARIEQLNTLARLRDSGALTQAEFEAEKKRVLGGF